MIVRLRGPILEKRDGRVVVEAAGVGFEVHVTAAASQRMPPEGDEVTLHVSESAPLYGGSTALYGFLAPDEKALFETLRDNVPNTGAKKALEILEKASRSLPDFRRCVLERDAKGLSETLGFTKKTAEKIVDALKDVLPAAGASSSARLASAPSGAAQQALQALAALGYKSAEARTALDGVLGELSGRQAPVEELVRLALKRL